MSAHVLELAVSLAQISCGECGGVYAINERVRQHHQERGTCWRCPYCGVSWGYPNKGTLAAKERELAEEKARHQRTLERLNATEKTATKLERKLKRVARGVCPQCNRTFRDLARHMSGVHGHASPLAVGAKPLP